MILILFQCIYLIRLLNQSAKNSTQFAYLEGTINRDSFRSLGNQDITERSE